MVPVPEIEPPASVRPLVSVRVPPAIRILPAPMLGASQGQVARGPDLQGLGSARERGDGRRGGGSVDLQRGCGGGSNRQRPVGDRAARFSVPPLAVIVPVVDIAMPTVPDPATLVFAAMPPPPEMAPPASVRPAASSASHGDGQIYGAAPIERAADRQRGGAGVHFNVPPFSVTVAAVLRRHPTAACRCCCWHP